MTATLLALPAPSGRTLHERLLEIVRPEFRAASLVHQDHALVLADRAAAQRAARTNWNA